MKTVKRADLAPIKMTTGGEKRHPRVILDGVLYNWVGFGWIDEQKATKSDREKYPTVRD